MSIALDRDYGPPPVVQTPPPPPPPPRPHDVAGYKKQIADTFHTQGAAAAAHALALAEADAALNAQQRKELLAQSRKVTDQIAAKLGQDARKTGLPASGQAATTTGIDDRDEYNRTLSNLAAATSAAGDQDETRHIAGVILDNTPAAAAAAQPASGLDLLGDSLRALPANQASLRDAVLFQLQAPQSSGTRPGSLLATALPSRTAVASALTLQTLLASPAIKTVDDVVKARVKALAEADAKSDPRGLDRLNELLNDPGFQNLDNEGKEILVLDKCSSDPAFAGKVDTLTGRTDLSVDERKFVLDQMVRPAYRGDQSFINAGANDRLKLANNVVEATGADPLAALDYVKKLDDGQVKGLLDMSRHLATKDGKVQATQDDEDYLLLPADPSKVDLSKYTSITFNGQTKRYEDPVTRSYWQYGRWYFDPRISNSMGYVPDTHAGLISYDPDRQGVVHQDGFLQQVQVSSTTAWENAIHTAGLPSLPVQAPPAPYTAPGTPAAPAAPTHTGALTAADAKSAKDYTGFETDLAHTLLLNARALQAKLGKLKPNSKAYLAAQAEYTDAANAAMGERAKSQQGVEAELRAVYLGDPRNAVATDDMAHAIADRYKDDPEAQLAVKDALQTVKTETPRQRETSIALNDLHRSENTLTQMKVEYDATGKVPAGFKQATADYQARRDDVMKVLSDEFAQAEQGLPDAAARSKAVDDLAMGMADRYLGDSTVLPLVDAARIVRHVADASGSSPADTITQQMAELGKSLPASSSLELRQAVMNDPAVKAIVDQYVDASAQSVTDAYNASVAGYKTSYSDTTKRGGYVPPATAAMNQLVAVTDPVNHPEVTPEITARIMNKLMAPPGSDNPGTLDRVVADVSYSGDHTGELCGVEGAPDGWQGLPSQGDESMRAWDMPDKQKIITELSLVTDRAAAGSQPTGKGHGMKWESGDVKKAVQGLASDITFNMVTDDYVRGDFNYGFQQAIAGKGGVTGSYNDAATKTDYTLDYAGGATLALEVAHQEIRFQSDDASVGTSVEPDRSHLVKDTLGFVSAGIDDLKKNSKSLFDSSHKTMASLEVTQSGYGQHMTAAQSQAGLDKVFKHAMLDPHDPNAVIDYRGALSGFVSGRMALDQRGYEIKRVDDMVDLYGTPADTPADWNTLVDGTYHGDDNLQGQDGFQQVAGKRNALMGDEQVLTMVAGSDRVATAASDMALHASLNWGQENGVLPPAAWGPIPVPLHLQWSGDTFEHVTENKFFNYTHGGGMGRLGHSLPATLLSFGSVGAGQLWYTDYLYHNVSFAPGQEWRKDALLAIVGGFAGIKAYQAGAVTAYSASKAFNRLPDSMKDILDRGNKMGNVEDFFKQHSEFVRTAGWKSVGAFGLLHADAMVWDASRVYYSLKDVGDGKPLDQRNFWTALGNLNCDWATSYGEIKAAYGLFKFPTGSDPALRKAIAAGDADLPMAAAEEAGVLYNSSLAKFGLGLAKGPGWAFDGAHYVLNSALKSGLEKIGVDLGERAMLADMPGAGTIALTIWTADDFINWIGNEAKTHKLDQNINYDFLSGAGISDDRAHILADNSLKTSGWGNWLSMNSLTEGLRTAYGQLGGDPDKFVGYINSISPKSLTILRDGLQAAKDADGNLPVASQDDYWTLPRDPNDPAQRQFNPNLHYNDSKHRWEDTHLKMFSAQPGFWMSIDHPYSDRCVTYTTYTHQLEHGMGSDSDAARPVQAPASQQGIVTWLLGEGLPIPAKTPDPTTLPPPPLDTSRTDKQNTYVVQPGDNVWEIADNDPARVQWIYDHNPWLNERMENDHRPINARGGQNPNYVDAGDILILPPGYSGPPAQPGSR